MSADLALIADEPSVLERVADPGEFLMLACERAKAWLAEALDHGEIDKIAEMKAQAEAIRVYTVSKQLGKDAQLSAAEIVRRAERGLGIATRRGQAAGRIRNKGANYGPRQDYERNGKPVHVDPGNDDNKVSPGEYVGHGAARVDIYAMADGLSDEGFDAILGEGRDEGNLSRSSIARKARQRRDQIPAATDRTTAARTLRIAYESFGDGGLDAAVISGIGLVCQRFNGQVDDAVAISQLGSVRNGVSGLMQQVAVLQQQTGKQRTHCVAAAAVDSYNRGRRSKRLPSWWKATAS